MIETSLPAAGTEIVAVQFVRGLPNSAVANQALRAAYMLLERLVRGDGLQPDEDRIVLDLSPLIEDVRAALRLPSDPESSQRVGRIVVVESNELSNAFSAVRWFDDWAPLIAILPVVAFVFALIVSPARATMLALIGALVAAGAGLRIVLAKSDLISSITDAVVSDATNRAAADAAYDVIAGTYVSQEIVVVAAGGAMLLAGVLLRVLTLRSY